ncbi:hypothetical protein D9M71_686870 [compost metagenome]
MLGVEQVHIGAVGYLGIVQAAQHFIPFVVAEEQVAVLVEGQVRAVAVHFHHLREVAHELGAEPGDLDVDRVGELLADRTARQRGGRLVVGPVAFDDQHRTFEVRIVGQEIGGGAAVDRAADDHHIIVLLFSGGSHGVSSLLMLR